MTNFAPPHKAGPRRNARNRGFCGDGACLPCCVSRRGPCAAPSRNPNVPRRHPFYILARTGKARIKPRFGWIPEKLPTGRGVMMERIAGAERAANRGTGTAAMKGLPIGWQPWRRRARLQMKAESLAVFLCPWKALPGHRRAWLADRDGADPALCDAAGAAERAYLLGIDTAVACLEPTLSNTEIRR